MIIRRIAEHAKSQDWFSVMVEFAIVVAGVFMGLQVQDWSEERKERIEENELLDRLYEETQELLEAQRRELQDLRARTDTLAGINPVLYSQEPARAFSVDECREIVASHVNRRPPDELPVLDEMLATGEFGTLRDKVLKEQLRKYILIRERARSHYYETVNELFRLHSRYPDLITIGLVPIEAGQYYRSDALSGEGFGWYSVCNVEKMRANAAFLNEYADNLARMNSIAGFVEQRQENLEELEAALSARLGTAGGTGPTE